MKENGREIEPLKTARRKIAMLLVVCMVSGVLLEISVAKRYEALKVRVNSKIEPGRRNSSDDDRTAEDERSRLIKMERGYKCCLSPDIYPDHFDAERRL